MSKEDAKVEELEQEDVEVQAEEEPIFNEEDTPIEAEEEQDNETNVSDEHLSVIESYKEEVAKLETENEALNNQILRAKADYENLRRRTNDEKIAARKYRAQELIENILPVLDNFERALDTSIDNDETKALQQGMEMVYRQLVDALQKEGVEEIQAVGESFDPNVHQAVMQEASDDYESNVVIDVLQKGYQLNGRVVRPAMVKVSS